MINDENKEGTDNAELETSLSGGQDHWENANLGSGHIPRVVPGSVAQKLGTSTNISSQRNIISATNPRLNSQGKINKLMGDEPLEDAIFREIKKDILSEDTTEGRSRRKFLLEFQKHGKDDNNISAVREFMNQLKLFMIQRRKEKHQKNLLLCVDYDSKSSTDKENKEDQTAAKVEALFNELLELSIEETVLQPKIDEVTRICENQTSLETEKLQAKVMRLTRYPQAYFGIKAELESTENWGTAVYELSLVRGCVLPSEKIRSIVNTVKAIHISFEREQTEKAKQKKK